MNVTIILLLFILIPVLMFCGVSFLIRKDSLFGAIASLLGAAFFMYLSLFNTTCLKGGVWGNCPNCPHVSLIEAVNQSSCLTQIIATIIAFLCISVFVGSVVNLFCPDFWE